MRKRFILWAVWLLFSGLLCFFENNTGTRIAAAASAAVPLLSMLLAHAASSRICIHLEMPERILAGDIPVRVRAGNCTLFGYILHINLTVTHSLLNRQGHHDLTMSDSRVGTLVLNEPAGAVKVSIRDAKCLDLFGLMCFPVQADSEQICVIEPETYPVTVLTGTQTDWLLQDAEQVSQGTGQDPFDLSGIRVYQPGDPVKRIHWKRSAGLDELLVREGNENDGPRVCLCLDDTGEMEPGEYDTLMSAIVSCAVELSGHMPVQIGCRSGTWHSVSGTDTETVITQFLLGEFAGMPIGQEKPVSETAVRHMGPDNRDVHSWNTALADDCSLILLFTDCPDSVLEPDWYGIPCIRIVTQPEHGDGSAAVLNADMPVLALP